MSRLFTIGHSTRTSEELVDLLAEHRVELVVDVRRYPGSRRHPHFARQALAVALAKAGIAYRHAPDLGGYRSARPDSPNAVWREKGLRAYADYLATDAGQAALGRLIEEAAACPSAILCAEADPARCHCQLIADALVARGWEVIHILALGASRPHELHPAARKVEGGRLIYPAEVVQTTLFSVVCSSDQGRGRLAAEVAVPPLDRVVRWRTVVWPPPVRFCSRRKGLYAVPPKTVYF